jgi:hypothetical protein
MVHFRSLRSHRSWEDWLGMLVGITIALSPWISGQMGSQAMMFNAIVTGGLVFLLSQMEATNLHRWEQLAEIALGLWFGASPFIFGYSEDGPLRFWHFALAGVIVVLALVELWQDWNLSDRQLAEHGE